MKTRVSPTAKGETRVLFPQRGRGSFPGALAAGVVDGEVFVVFPRQNELADGDDLVALLDQVFQDAGQSFRRVEGGVVEEDDGAGADLGRDPLGDGGSVVILPVQTVPIGSGCKGENSPVFSTAGGKYRGRITGLPGERRGS